MKEIVAGIIAYGFGIISFLLTLKIFLDETITLSGGFLWILFWVGFIFIMIAVPSYLLSIWIIKKIKIKNTFIAYPTICMIFFFLPISFIATIWDRHSNILTPEVMILNIFMLTNGFVFGITYYLLEKNELKRKESKIL